MGDVTVNGRVTLVDMIYMQKYLLRLRKLSAEGMMRADMNFDGRVNVFDLTALKHLLVS